MAWRDRMRKATFRDVPFEVREDSGKFGRRLQTHEYPQRDKPHTEDLGRSAREFTVQGFVVGADYMEKRDALMSALEQAGPGTLVHPWWGTLQVNVGDVNITHNLAGGTCEFSIHFVEAGELVFPAAADSAGAQTLAAADNLAEVSQVDFLENYGVEGFPAFVQADTLSALTGFVGTAQSTLGGLTQVLANPLSSVLQHVGDPAGLASAVRGLFAGGNGVLQVASSLASVFGGSGVHARNRNAVLSLSDLSGQLATAAGTAPTSTAPATRQVQANTAAVAALLQRTALVQASGMVAAMSLPVYDDAVQIRSSLLGSLDQASESAPDEVYQALQELRARVHADVTSRLASSARMVTIRPTRVQPALVLAYDRYEDVARDQEIVERNRVRHPGFLPAEPLRVLAS